MNCSAGQTYFVIPPSGKVWRCWAHQREEYGSVSDLALRPQVAPCPEFRCRACERQCNVIEYKDGIVRGQGASRGPNHLVFRVMPILGCNYACPYCITETKNNKLFDIPRAEHRVIPASSWCTWWSFIKQRSERCDVYVSGGEPTIYPGFHEFIQAVDRLPGSHWLATNLSRPVPALEEGLVKRFDVDASAHLSEPQFDAEVFLQRARLIANHVPLRIKVVHGHAPEKALAEFQAAAINLKLRLSIVPDRQDRRKATPPTAPEAPLP